MKIDFEDISTRLEIREKWMIEAKKNLDELERMFERQDREKETLKWIESIAISIIVGILIGFFITL